MRRSGGLVLAAALAGTLFGASRPQPIGSAERGRGLIQSKNCMQCHSVNGQGATTAPDLSETVVRGFSPYQLAAAMWNHLPGMVTASRQKGLAWPELTEQDAADLFLYLYTSRYFEGPGNAGRGGRVFRSKRCGECHGMTSPVREGIQPVSSWGALNNPIALVQDMLNHRTEMVGALSQRKVAYPRLSSGELTDLLTYLRSQIPASGAAEEFSPGSPEQGRKVLLSRGCQACHQGSRSLEERPTRHTLMDFASAMWNHPHRETPKSSDMTYQEMRDLVGYLLATQFTTARGDQVQGQRVYARKGCSVCHENPASGAPLRADMAGRINSLAMIEVISKHGPAMLERMRDRRLDWPRINSLEMGDLVAFLHGSQLRRRP